MNKFINTRYLLSVVTTLIVVLFLAGCKKDSEPPFIAKEVLPEELLPYYIVSEVQFKGTAANSYGDKSYVEVLYFKNEGADLRLYTAFGFMNSHIKVTTHYDASTGITTVLNSADETRISLTRDKENNIILSNNIQSIHTGSEIVYSQLIKASGLNYHSNTLFKGVENNTGYFKFQSGKWKYAPTNSFPAIDWNFSASANFLWTGYDGGTTNWFNFFVAVPKGQGWKGQRKDKDLLLVHYITPQSKSVDGIVVCERQ